MECLGRIKEFLKADRKMIPMKLHYFFYGLAFSCTVSYFPIIAKNIGISATAVGVIYTVSPFITVLINPIIGWIADKLRRIQLVIIFLLIIQTPLCFSTVFVPPLPSKPNYIPVELSCSSNKTYIIISPIFLTHSSNNGSLICNSDCLKCPELGNSNPDNVALCGKTISLKTEELYNISYDFAKITNISVKGVLFPLQCYEDPSNECKTECEFHAESKTNKKNEFETYQFWTLLFLIVSSLVFSCGILAISDAACYEALEGKVNQFGKQRLWLSVGKGAGTMITGYILDLTNQIKGDKVDFSNCAYIMIVVAFIDIIVLSQAYIRKPSASKNIFKDVCKIFARPHPIFFAIAAIMAGSFTGLRWNYVFWYLTDLGATKFLLGFSTAVQHILVDTPFMLIAGWVVKRIGRDNSTVLSSLTFAIWFFSVSYIHNPWWIILIYLTQGPSFSLFYVSMTSYGKKATAPGTEATMQAFLGLMFHGIGIGSGSLLGGLGFDLYGARATFRFAAYVAVGAAIIFKILTTFVAGERTAIYKGDKENAEDAVGKMPSKQDTHAVY